MPNYALPVGTIVPYAGGMGGAPPPEGWLFCRGQQVSRSVYSALFSIIGTQYGTGDGVNTFHLPDPRGRVLGFPDEGMERLTAYSMDSVAAGGVGGEERHTLTESEMPSHHHNFGASDTETPGTIAPLLSEDSTVSKDTSDVGGNQPHLNVQPTLIVGGAIIFCGA